MRRLIQFIISAILVLETGLSTVVAAAQVQPDDYIRRVLELSNQARLEQGLPPLVKNALLSAAAQKHADAMASRDFYAHDDPQTGSTLETRLNAEGYQWQMIAENIAAGQATPEEVVQAWLLSPKHRDNLLNPELLEIGVGYVFDVNDSYPASENPYKTYWVQDFGTPQAASTQDAINAIDPAGQAIDRGLAYLHNTMTRPDNLTGYWAQNPYIDATTGMAILALLLQGHPASGEPAIDPYVDDVQRGMNYLLNTLRKQDITSQPAGNPDTNGNGFGLFPIESDTEITIYTAGIILQALAATGTPEAVALTGEDGVRGRTYKEIAQDIVDYLAWAQTDEPEDRRGGWRYQPNDDADMSVTQWPVIGMEAAEKNWSVIVPQWVKTELALYLAKMQDSDGGFGYSDPGGGKNISTTGSGIISLLWTGHDPNDPQVKKAQDFISGSWNEDHIGNLYAMYGISKASRLAEPAIQVYGAHDWDQEYVDYLVNNQQIDGSWLDMRWAADDVALATAWGILILSRAVIAPELLIPETVSETSLVTMTITADPVTAAVDESITVQILLSGESDQCGQSVVVKPVDVILVLDHSGSMDGEPLAQAKIAAKAFVDAMNLSADRVGVVQFSGDASLIHPLDDNPGAIKESIDRLSTADSTAIDEGLDVAFKTLTKENREGASPIIILLSDGNSDPLSAIFVANNAKAAGIRIVTVGLGEVNQDLLKEISTPDKNGNPQFRQAPEPAALKDIYLSIAQNIREYGLASNLTLRHQVDIYKFAIVAESLNPAGTIAGDTITWTKEVLEEGDTIFSYQVRARQAGEFNIGQVTEATFFECEQNDRVLRQDNVPEVNIEGDTKACSQPVPSTCSSLQLFPWWILIPLLILFALILWLYFTPTGRTIRRNWLSKPLLCKILSLASILYIILLSGIFAFALIGDLCHADHIYFWKIITPGDEIGIYETSDNAKSSRPVSEMNGDSQCVACHTSSNTAQLLSGVQEDQNGPIVINNVDGKEVAIPEINGSYLAFSPDGQKAVISYNDQDLHILDLQQGTITPLSGASEPDVIETMPSWSPDGQVIAFVRAARTDERTAELDVPCDIYTVPAIGGEALPLPGASGDGFNYYPAYSPNGRWLAFTRHIDGVHTYGDDASDLYLVPAGGGERTLLRANSTAADSWPSWSTDSRWLGFNSNRKDGQFDVCLTEISSNGQSYSQVYYLPGAADPLDEEFHPVWLQRPVLPWWQRLIGLWPWLLPLPVLLFLTWLFCRKRKYLLSGEVSNAITREPIHGAQVQFTIPSQTSLTTDMAGRYSTRTVAGKYQGSAKAAGFIGQTKLGDIIHDTIIDFVLYPIVEVGGEPPLPAPLPSWKLPPVWQPDPVLIIGLGGTGRHVLTHIKKNLRDAGAGEISDAVRLVLLDTSDYELLNGEAVPVSFAGESLDPEHVVEFGEDLNPVKRQILDDKQAQQEIRDWFPAKEYNDRLSDSELMLERGTLQRRPLARAAIVRDIHRGRPQKGLDVVLAIDCSYEMQKIFEVAREPVNRLSAAKSAAIRFIDQMNHSIDRVALVHYGEDAVVDLPFSQDLRNTIDHIGKLEVDNHHGSLNAALAQAFQLLQTTGANALPVVVVLTCGGEDASQAQAKADAIQQGGARLIILGVDAPEMNGIKRLVGPVGTGSIYENATNSTALNRLAVRVGRRLGQGSLIWRLLQGGAEATLNRSREGDPLRVILVGSLCGGFGSAVLADIAYLTRRVVDTLNARATIEAYLATNGAFSQVTTRPEIDAGNTFGALRELERFQLAQGRPFRMVYDYRASNDPVLAGVLKERLFDELYLFDTPPDPIKEQVGVGEEERDYGNPVDGIFPAMADAITLWLDKASRTSRLSEYRGTVRGDVSRVQNSKGRCVVGGLGTYVYRLPLLDIVGLLKAQWARTLLHQYITGNISGELRIDAKQNMEEHVETINEQIHLFLVGLLGFDGAVCPPGTQLVGWLEHGGLNIELAERQRELHPGDVIVEQNAFQIYLGKVLRGILNGRGTSSTIQARCGKLGYGFYFLEALGHALDRAEEAVRHPAVDLPTEVQAAAHQAASLISAFQAERVAAEEQLYAQARIISQTLHNRKEEKPQPGLYERLVVQEKDFQGRLNMMDRILTRQYILSPDLIETWRKTYFSDVQAWENALCRLHWQTDDRGHIYLALLTWNENPRLLTSDEPGQMAFMADLLALAEYSSRQIWEQETLASALVTSALAPDQIDSTANQLKIGSRPLLRYDQKNAENMLTGYVLAVNDTVNRVEKLEKLIRLGLPVERQMMRLKTTDPFTMLLAQMVDVIPLNAIPSITGAESVYMRWYGLMKGVPADKRAEPTAVFRAEKISLDLEQQIEPKLHRAAHLLHPVIVTGLDAGGVARYYCQALAAGWIQRQGRSIVLRVPGAADQAITEVHSDDRLHPFVQGYVQFCAHASEAQVKVIEDAVKNTLEHPEQEQNQKVLKRWKQWASNEERIDLPLVEELTPAGPEAADLVIVTSLAVPG